MFGASVHIDVLCIMKETRAALQVCDVAYEIYWLPKSQIQGAEKLQAGNRHLTIEISEWIAIQKGFLEEHAEIHRGVVSESGPQDGEAVRVAERSLPASPTGGRVMEDGGEWGREGLPGFSDDPW